MSKKGKILFSTILGVFLTFGIYFLGIKLYDFKLFTNGNYIINIHNITNKPLENLELSFYNGDTIEKIANIEPKKTWIYNLNTESIKGESSVYLTYKDNKNNIQKACVIGYLEKGYGGKENLKIKGINEDGILQIK